jgi:carbohydrate-selective porin OprB
MNKILPKKALFVLAFLPLCNSIYAQNYLCDVPDIVKLSPNELEARMSLTHVWQGAIGGINTKNADRISGLYDFDLYYLISAKEARDLKGDYVLLCVSNQASFGHGLKDSKLGSFFETNDAAKGDHSLIIDKLFVQFTAFDRSLMFDIGKIEIKDLFDSSAVAHCEKSQFIAEPLVHNLGVPWPSHGLGIRMLWEPSDFWYVQAGIGDAQADKRETGLRTAFHDEDYFFNIAEIGLRPDLLNLSGTYRFMIWYDPQDKSYLDGSSRSKRDDLGFALSFDQKITQKTTTFFRYGWADDKVNEVEDFVSFGAQIEGFVEGRDRDVLAAAYVYGLRSPNGLASKEERQIDMIEAYYGIEINENAVITPNIQFIMDPGGLKNESPAVAFGLRCRIKF